MARIVSEVRPGLVYLENSPLLVGRSLAVVLSDLAEMGYDASWGIVGATDLGAPHKRDRIWIVAETTYRTMSIQDMANSRSKHVERLVKGISHPQIGYQSHKRQTRSCSYGNGCWATEPRVGRVAHGVAYRVDRLKAIGNGQIPQVAASAFHFMTADKR